MHVPHRPLCICPCVYLAFMPGLTSTVLSELATTRTNTSPASGWFCLFKYLFTLSSIYVPNRVDCNPVNTQTQIKTVHENIPDIRQTRTIQPFSLPYDTHDFFQQPSLKNKGSKPKKSLTFSRKLVFLPCLWTLLQTVVTDKAVETKSLLVLNVLEVFSSRYARNQENCTHPEGQMTS